MLKYSYLLSFIYLVLYLVLIQIYIYIIQLVLTNHPSYQVSQQCTAVYITGESHSSTYIVMCEGTVTQSLHWPAQSGLSI